MVLIVEDESVARHALQQLLRLDGMEARAVPSAEEAMELLAQGSEPNVALVDINLPGMNGVEFARRLQHLHPSVPCVFMTANDDALVERRRNSPPGVTLRKPLNVSRLLDLLHHIPGRGGAPAA